MAGASYDRYNAYVALPQIEAEVKEIKKAASSGSSSSCPFPVGSVLLFNDATDPNTTWGGTTWQAIGSDCYLVGSGSTHATGGTGGSNTHTLTTGELPSHSHSGASHRHTIDHGHSFTQPTASSDTHTHALEYDGDAFASGTGAAPRSTTFCTSTWGETSSVNPIASHRHTHTISGGAVTSHSGSSGYGGGEDTGSTGSGNAFSIEPRYYTVAIWARTA